MISFSSTFPLHNSLFKSFNFNSVWCLLTVLLILAVQVWSENLFVLSSPLPPLLNISSGTILGSVSNYQNIGSIVSFYQIPYSAPTVGPLRWKSPQPVSPWSGVLDVSKNKGTQCLNGAGYSPHPNPSIIGQEDCLVLSVLVPNTTAPIGGFPVVVWICGGAFQGCDEEDNKGYLVALTQSIIYVTIQYRLGVMGFLAMPELSAENSIPHSGNYGLEDQSAALLWVQKNIAFFGGNPNQVTIHGESAGSISVCFHLIMPASKGLFHRAIMESGGCTVPIKPWFELEPIGYMVANATSCSNRVGPDRVTCLRSLSALDLLKAQASIFQPPAPPSLTLLPNADGYVIPDNPVNLLKAGKMAVVPALLGTNGGEGEAFLFSDRSSYTWQDVTDLATIASNHSEKVIEYYTPVNYPDHDANWAAIDVIGTPLFHCDNLRTSISLYKLGERNIFHYQFNAITPGYRFPRASHAEETNYVFNKFGNPTADERILAAQIQSYWSRFIVSPDANVNTVIPQLDSIFSRIYTNHSLVQWGPFVSPPKNFSLLLQNSTEAADYSHFVPNFSPDWLTLCAELWDSTLPNYTIAPRLKWV